MWEGTVAASGYYQFAQTSDGAKSFAVTVKASINTNEENCNGSGSWSLPSMSIYEPTNETESTFELSATNINIGGVITADITSSNSNYNHDVEFYLSGYGGGSTSEYYTKYTGIKTSVSFTIPETWYNYMVSTTTCTAYCKVTTWNGGTIVGSEVIKPFTVKVLSSVVPTIGSMTLDPDDFTIGGSFYDYLVKGKNKLIIGVSGCAPTPGSKIESYTFIGPSINTSITTTNNSASTIIDSVASYGELTYKVTIKDSRGHKTTIQKNISCYNYQRPYFSFFNASRNGTILSCTLTPSFSDVNNKNKATVKIYANDILIYTIENIANNTKVSRDIELNSDKKHDVYAIITDALGESSSSKDTETYGREKILNLASDGLGLAVGKMSTQHGFECSWDGQFYGDVNISKSINVDGSGNFDGSLFVNNDITTDGGIVAIGDIITSNDVYANNIQASVLYGSVEGTYVDVNKVTSNNIIMSGKLYQSTEYGNKLIYGISSTGTNKNLQVGSPGSSAYYNATIYAPGNVYLVPGGTQLDNDGWTVSVRNYVDGNGDLKQGVSVNGNISCDGNMYIDSKRVLTTADLEENGDLPEINNGHFHSGKTLKCIGITPKEKDGKTDVSTFTIDATVVTGRVRPSSSKSVSCGGSNYLWSTMYTSGMYIEGSTASDATTQDGGVFIKNLPTATKHGANVRIDDEGRLYKVSESLVNDGAKATALYLDDSILMQTAKSENSDPGGVKCYDRLYPSTNSTSSSTGKSLGSANFYWNTLYVRNISVKDSVPTNLALEVNGRIKSWGRIYPPSSDDVAGTGYGVPGLGDSTHPWAAVYANTVYEDGTKLEEKYALKSEVSGGNLLESENVFTNKNTFSGSVYFTNPATASNYGPNLRISDSGQLYKTVDGAGLSLSNTFTNTNTFEGDITLDNKSRIYTNRIMPNSDANYSIGDTGARYVDIYLSGHVKDSSGNRKYALVSELSSVTAVFG